MQSPPHPAGRHRFRWEPQETFGSAQGPRSRASSDTVVVGHLGETPGTAATEYPPSTVTGPRERTDEAAGTNPERPATDLDRASPHATSARRPPWTRKSRVSPSARYSHLLVTPAARPNLPRKFGARTERSRGVPNPRLGSKKSDPPWTSGPHRRQVRDEARHEKPAGATPAPARGPRCPVRAVKQRSANAGPVAIELLRERPRRAKDQELGNAPGTMRPRAFGHRG